MHLLKQYFCDVSLQEYSMVPSTTALTTFYHLKSGIHLLMGYVINHSEHMGVQSGIIVCSKVVITLYCLVMTCQTVDICTVA